MKQRKGFTIIEVVLVLAIAGLIFMMVFIALPALQRSQRDTQRRNDIARAQTAVNNFQTNNRGRVPRDTAEFNNTLIPQYLLVGGDIFQDPDGTPYTFRVDPLATFNPAMTGPGDGGHVIGVILNAQCDGETPIASTGGNNRLALIYNLEGGGVICINN
ncbi:type II secretion system GspH family protein [Candidatus Saccharibacteria bacterium]|nr:type II secretion system GspH family protein [Candidatus Saccharibacteria bacterium]